MIDNEENNSLIDSTINKRTLTNNEILSQAFMFLFAGFDTNLHALMFISYSLATNPNHQETLCQEIDKVLDKYVNIILITLKDFKLILCFNVKDGSINYESLNEMKFMDMIIDETLRLHPVSLRIDRETSNDYENNNIKIKKGTLWAIPIYALHHDSSIYPEPDIFNLYRFDEIIFLIYLLVMVHGLVLA